VVIDGMNGPGKILPGPPMAASLQELVDWVIG
jgi:hypothetical protein